MKCQATTKTGKKCKILALAGSDFCHIHGKLKSNAVSDGIDSSSDASDLCMSDDISKIPGMSQLTDVSVPGSFVPDGFSLETLDAEISDLETNLKRLKKIRSALKKTRLVALWMFYHANKNDVQMLESVCAKLHSVNLLKMKQVKVKGEVVTKPDLSFGFIKQCTDEMFKYIPEDEVKVWMNKASFKIVNKLK